MEVGLGVEVIGPAVVIDLVADLPVLDSDGRGMRDAEEVIAVICGERVGGTKARPEADGLPVKARGVQADGLRAGG